MKEDLGLEDVLVDGFVCDCIGLTALSRPDELGRLPGSWRKGWEGPETGLPGAPHSAERVQSEEVL